MTTLTNAELARTGPALIAPAEARRRLAGGWHAADLHVHTSCSHDVLAVDWLSPKALYEKARTLGFRYVTFTDHDTMDAFDQVGWTRPGIVPGVELTFRDAERVGHTIHVNVYELNRRQFSDLRDLAARKPDLRLLLAYLSDHRLPHTYNHPFWFEKGESPNLGVIPDLIPLFPVVEYNMHRVRTKNRMTLALARRHGVGVVAATDTHIGDLGKAYTVARGETFRAFHAEIAAGRAGLVPADLTTAALTEEARNWIELIFAAAAANRGRKEFAEVRTINWLVAVLGGRAARRVPALPRLLKRCLRGLAASRLPLALYVRSQESAAARICRELELALPN